MDALPTVARPIQYQLKCPHRSQRERYNGAITKFALKHLFIVSVPTYRHVAILIQIEIATIWPSALPPDATKRHERLKKFDHPGWKFCWVDLDTTIFICTSAPLSGHPISLPR